MKLLTVLIALYAIVACGQPSENGKGTSLGEDNFNRKDTIIDPVVPYNFELHYKKILKISPGTFPQGVNGIGVLRVFVNNDSEIERFEIVSIKIKNDGKLIYDYTTDRENHKTQQFDTILRSFVKEIRVEKIRDTLLKNWDPYVIGIRFE